jgi:putative sterol carrier protein
MAVDIQKLFNEDLPAKLARNPEEAKTINARFQLNVTGAGSWNADLTSSGPKITAGEGPSDCTITVSSDDFQKLVDNPALGAQLFFSGKLKIAGNQMLGLKLQKLFSLK